MHPAIRTQHDKKQLKISRANAVPKDPDAKLLTRQEFKADADINNILQRFGVMGKIPVWGTTIDYNIDLQGALNAVAEAKQAWRSMPPELKKRYPTWNILLNEIESGNLKIQQTDPDDKPPTRKEMKEWLTEPKPSPSGQAPARQSARADGSEKTGETSEPPASTRTNTGSKA